MPREIKKEPSLLPHVIKAISKLKDDDGSTTSRILSCVQALLRKADINVKKHKLATHVEKAIQHGVDTGLLKVIPGKYLLGSQCTFDVDCKEADKDDVNEKKQLTAPDATHSTHSVVSGSSTDVNSMEDPEESQNKASRRKRGSKKRRRTDAEKNTVPSGAATPEPDTAVKKKCGHHSSKLSHGHGHKRKEYASAIKSRVCLHPQRNLSIRSSKSGHEEN